MCIDPITAALVASTALEAGGQIMAGNDAARAGKNDGRQYEINRKRAQVETSESIRLRLREAETIEGTNRLAIAASGLAGVSFEHMLAGNRRLAVEDARALAAGGRARAAELRYAGLAARADGKARRTQGYIGAAGSVLRSGITYETNRMPGQPSLLPQNWGQG